MANCKNSVSLIGFVGNDVEVRQTDKGVKYARINLATLTGGYKKKDGTDVPEVTQWHTCVAWGITAEYAGKYIKKGAKISIDGMLIYSKYTDNQGIERISAKISVQEICLFVMPQQQAQQAQQAQTIQQPQAEQAEGLWKCSACGHENTGNFCGECGAKKPEGGGFCSNCGHKFEDVKPKFCPQCGTKQE